MKNKLIIFLLKVLCRDVLEETLVAHMSENVERTKDIVIQMMIVNQVLVVVKIIAESNEVFNCPDGLILCNGPITVARKEVKNIGLLNENRPIF